MSVNYTGALLLAAAIAKVFSKEEICFSHADHQGFSVEFTSAEPFQESYLGLLEKAMRELAGEEIELMEMLASNARELFLHRGQKNRAETLQGIKGTVEVAKIGSFAELCLGQLTECHHFSLIGFEEGHKHVTIFGMAFTDAHEQKSFFKKFRTYPKLNHEYLAKELELYDEAGWHPTGMALRRLLIDLWREHLEKEGFFEVFAEDPSLYYSKTGRKKFSCWNGIDEMSYDFSGSVISSLQFIQKWIKIFDFETKWVFVPFKDQKQVKSLKNALAVCGIDYLTEERDDGPKIELQIADGIGRYWPGPMLQLRKGETRFSLFGDLDCFIGRLIERYKGEFPFWLCPYQVRLLPLEGVDIEPVIKIFKKLNIRFHVDNEDLSLKEKMHRALRAKVPYVMVFGKREEHSGQINVRGSSPSLEKTMTFENMEKFLAEQKLEN